MIAFGMAAVPAMASTEPSTVEAVNEQGTNCPYVYGYGYSECHHWSNATQTISAGQKVTFSNLSNPGVPHGVEWRSPLHGECEKGAAGEGNVPVGTTEAASATNWSGKCTFTQPGVYTFWCTRHHQEMSGTITVTGTPKDETTAAGAENQTEATVNGSIEPEGNAVEYHFEYGTGAVSENKTTSVTVSAGTFTSQPVSAQLKGLRPGATYRFLLVATYGGKGVSGASELTFNTPAAAPPAVEGAKATVNGQHEATLEGKVDPDGGTATEYFFEYATAAEYEPVAKTYGHTTPPATGLPADNVEHVASMTVSELQASTLYHFRLVAKSSAGGPVASADETFTTASPPPPEKEVPAPPPTSPAPPTPIPMPGPISPEPEIAPMGPVIVQGSLKLAAAGHAGHAVVHVSLDVGQSGAGDRLEIDLLAKGSSLTAHRHSAKQVNVGRLVRASVSAGKLSLSVALNALAKRALHRAHKLVLTVETKLTPTSGVPTTVEHSIVLRS